MLAVGKNLGLLFRASNTGLLAKFLPDYCNITCSLVNLVKLTINVTQDAMHLALNPFT